MIVNQPFPSSATTTNGQGPGRPVTVAIKETPQNPPLVESLLSGVSLVAKVLLCVGLGAILLAWETIGKLFRPMQESISIGPVGPGQPTAAAPSPTPQPTIKVPLMPIDDYSRWDEEEIIRRLDTLTARQLRVIDDFERAHLHRPRILQEIDRMLATR
jgi:hypothetical protein